MNLPCLEAALAQAGAVALSGTAYRVVLRAFANPTDLLSGAGSAKAGGRWNPPGIRAVYFSEDAALAVREAGYNLSLGGKFSGHPRPPMVVFSVRVDLQRLVRVDAAFVKTACLNLAELLREDFASPLARGVLPASMQVGAAVRAAGFEGLLAPSARDPRGYNLVIFPDRLLPGSGLGPVLE